MKSQFKYFILPLFLSFYLGCNNPPPTALVDQEDNVQIEVINKNPTDPTNFGIDTSGLKGNSFRFENIISVTGSKTIIRGFTTKTSFAQAVFFDKSKPVFGLNNRIVGFKTRTPGTIFFNNKKAMLRELKLKYGTVRDTSLGLRYVLHRRGNIGDAFEIDFNNKVSFTFLPDSAALSTISFDIPTPPEIVLTAKLIGRKQDGDLNLLLEWNAAYVNDFEILLSLVDNQNDIIPLYKIKTADDGKFKMPKNLLDELSTRFNSILFTLTRKLEKQHLHSSSVLFVVSQSISSILVDIP